jgi:hypothetical protein
MPSAIFDDGAIAGSRRGRRFGLGEGGGGGGGEEEEWTGVLGREFICVRLRRGGNPSRFLGFVAGLTVEAHTASLCRSALDSLWPIVRARLFFLTVDQDIFTSVRLFVTCQSLVAKNISSSSIFLCTT